MRVRVSARAPPYRGDHFSHDRGRAGKRHARAQPASCPARQSVVGMWNRVTIEFSAPLERGEKITDPLDNCKANARHASDAQRLAAGSPGYAEFVLHVHRAPRADRLASALAAMLAHAPADPFAADVVAVPTRGMERWLTQHMSAVLGATPERADGVCANVLFPTPHRLIADAAAAACEIDPARDPWLPERAVWPLLAIVDEALHEPWLTALATYLRRRLRRVVQAVTAAQRRRPPRDAVRPLRDAPAGDAGGVAAGRDDDASGAPLRAEAAWQAELWRRLRARIAVPSPAERRLQARERLIAEPGLAELPERISLFGLTRLPAGQLQILRALAAHRDVHLFLLHPSPALWAGSPRSDAAAADAPAAAPAIRPRSSRANRLLASWGRDAREMQLVLAPTGAGPGDAAPVVDHDEGAEPFADTLLGRLQADIRDDRARPGAPIGDGPDADRRRRRPIAASRSTPVTAACARSRCCATRSCTRSPPTTRSSRAT